VDQIAERDPNDLVFVDEFGTNLGMTRRYARAPRGVRAHGAVPKNPDPTITLTMGLGAEGVVAPFAFEGTTDGTAFLAYVEKQLVPELKPGQVVLVDNLGAHRTHGVREAIEGANAELIYLPPYSPDFSPVENCGSKVKEAIRADAPRTPAAVYDSMGYAIGAVTPSDARGWFDHCGYRIPRTCSPL
jgi:transposase